MLLARAARVRVHRGGTEDGHRADGVARPGARRLHGQRCGAGGPLGPAATPLRLLQATLRPGHQPADRPAARGTGHVADELRGPRAEPAGRDARARPPPEAAAPDPDDRGPDPPAPRPQARRRRAATSTSLPAPTAAARPCGRRLDGVFAQAEKAIADGATFLLLTDAQGRQGPRADPGPPGHGRPAPSPDPPGLRTRASLVVESGEVREVMHFALLIGFGANAICPTWPWPPCSNWPRRTCSRSRLGPRTPPTTTSRRSRRAC